MEGSIFRFVWFCLAVPGANLIPVTKDDEIEKQDDGTQKEIASSDDKVNDDSDTNPDSEPDIDNGVAVKRALTTGNDEQTTSKTSLPLQQDKTMDTQIYTQLFGSPGPPHSYFFDDINKFKNGTTDPTKSKSDLHLQTGDPFVMTEASKSQKNMQNISMQYHYRVPSLSTLSQDDMTMDAVMGRPPRLTEAGLRLQREQEERQRARQQTLRELNREQSLVEMKKGDTFLLSAPAPRELSKQPINFNSEPIDECVTEKQRPVLMEYKPKLKKDIGTKKSEKDAEMMKFIKDLARSVKQPEPYVKYFDAAVVYDKHDYEEVKEFIDELKVIAATEVKHELRIELFDSEEFAQSMVMVISDVIERCSVVFVYLTENSNTDLITLFCDEAVGLSRLGLNDPGVVPGRRGPGRQWMLKPVHTQPLKCRQYPTPVGLLTLTGLDWYDWPSLFVRDRAKSILSSAIANRKSKEATQNISNKYDSVLGSKPREVEKNELLWTKLGSRDSTTSMDALSVHAARSLKSSVGVSAQNGENNTHFLARRNTTGGLSCPVDPQQINRQTDRLSYFQKPLIQQRTQGQQFQHQIPNRTMPNSGAPAINNVQGQPRMQLFTPSPQVPRHENPVYSPGPQMHPASTTTLHPSSLYEDQLSYQYQNTTPTSRPPSLIVFPKLGANREVGIQHHIFEQNLHENENRRQQTRLTGEQNIQQGNDFDSLVGEPYHLPNREAEQNRLQNIPGGKSQHRLTDEHNQVTKREAWQQLNSFERDLYGGLTWLNGESNETNVPQQDRFTNGQRIPRVHLQNRPTGENSLQESDEHLYQQQTRLDDKPNVIHAGEDRFTSLPRVYLQNRHIGEHSQKGVGHFNGAEYGSLMLDPRHDTPPSSQLTVVSRLTGRLITNPDLSNSDLEIDGDRNPDTLPHAIGVVDAVEADASDSSDDGDDDDVAISDDSDYEDSLKEIFLKKGKVLNIIGSSVVQLGRANVSLEQYITKHKHRTKGHDSKCKTVKGKDDEGLPQTLSRVKDCSPTLQTNRKQNSGVSDDDSGNKKLSLTKPAESNQRTQASDDGYRDKRYSPILPIKSDRRTRTSDGDHRDRATSLIKHIIKSDQRTRTSDDEDTTLTAREAQQLARGIVDMRPYYFHESMDVNYPNLDHTSSYVFDRQPEASKQLNNVDAVRKSSDIRDTNRKIKETGVSADQGEVINDLDQYESLEDNSSYFDGSGQNTRTSHNTFFNHHDKPTADLPAQFAFSSFRTSIFTKLTGVADREQLGAEVCALETDLD